MMAKKVLFLILVSLVIKSVFWLRTSLPPAMAAGAGASVQESCAQPTGKAAQACHELEQRILAATIRIELRDWSVADDESGYDIDGKVSHATVRDGRYLVTHNHFSIPLPIRPGDEAPESYIQVILSRSSGEVLFRGPLSDFELAWEDPETLVLAHKDDGLFGRLGIASAEFSDWSSVPLEAGAEVAQVDWDGATSRVDWVKIQEVSVEGGVPQLVLADAVTSGASGGGIFWQGVHIANNWLLVQYYGESGALDGECTKAALNSVPVSG